MIYKNADELIKHEITLSLRRTLYPIIQIGEQVFRELYKNNYAILSSKYFKPILPRIRTKAIYYQFELDLLPENFPFKCRMKKTNNFGEYVPELSAGNIFLHIASAKDKDSLPSRSRYKLESSYCNNFDEKQTIFDFTDQSNPAIKDDKYYGIITYGGADTLEFLNLIIPNCKFEKILSSLDLKLELKSVKISSEDKDTKKKGIKIRDTILKELLNEEKRL
ncbi:hypothetical protein [Clostridium kluyveri]|jgi:hypothetical protein|uniref:Uncharacterized protein n=2 Tax=Clostridium kluyveri TaxID=1534 RepID=A5N981_CLOK5|nr:Hypothetical protein CKL_1820 [Clostridium kluyveri DSM 555]